METIPPQSLAAVLSTSLDAVVVIGNTGLVAGWNKNAQRIFGYTKEEAMHQQIADLIIPADGRAEHLRGMDRYLNTGVAKVLGMRLKVEAMHKDGHKFPVELAVMIYSGLGNHCFLGFIRDLTEETAAAAQIETLRAEVMQLSRLNAMGTAASMIAHELNQPLAAASNYLAACKHLTSKIETDELAQLNEGLSKAQESILRAAGVVKTVREVVSKQVISHERLDLSALINSSIKLVEARLSVPIEIDLAQNARVMLANKGQIEQVLINLIRNAAEAIVGQPEPRVVCSSERMGQNVKICIQDNGPGIDSKAQENLFAPFKSTKEDGLGLGLTICRTIVDEHGGNLSFETNASGTVFCFELPTG